MRSNIIVLLGLLIVSPLAYTSDDLERRVKMLEQRVSDLEKLLQSTLPTIPLSAEAITHEEDLPLSKRNEEELMSAQTHEEELVSAKSNEEEPISAQTNGEELVLAKTNEEEPTLAETNEGVPIFAKRNEGGIALSEWTYTYKRDSMSDYYVIQYVLKNNYDKNIKLVDGTIYFKDLLGKMVFETKITSDLKIPSGETAKDDVPYLFNQFMNEQLILKDTDKRDIVTDVVIRKLVFDDNTVLEM